MIRRQRKISFRLLPDEERRYLPLVRDHYLWSWSELIRKALKEYADNHPPKSPITMSDTPAASDMPAPLFEVKKKASKKVSKKTGKKQRKKVA